MKFRDYEKVALSTKNDAGKWRDRMSNWTLSLNEEAGEVAGLLKKALWHGHGFDEKEFVEELGDVLWYLTILANEVGTSLEEVAEKNNYKLAKNRYKGGFSQKKSIQRSD